MNHMTCLSNLFPKCSAHRRTTKPKLIFVNFVHFVAYRKCSISCSKLLRLPLPLTKVCARGIFATQLRLADLLKGTGQKKPAIDFKLNVAGEDRRKRSLNVVFYALGCFVLLLGLTYVAVPAYRVFCQATSLGGTVRKSSHLSSDKNKLESMTPVKNRLIKVSFEACTGGGMSWIFEPLQREIWVHPGETALAFFSATNPTASPIVGVSTYNVLPYDAGRYFSKVQCFCFEEQLLNPGEQLDMPVFFYIDPDYASDPSLENVDDIVLGYTFFESKDGLSWPLLPMPAGNAPPMHFSTKKMPASLDV